MTSLTAKPAVQPPLQPSPVLDRATWATLRADPALKDRQDKIGKILHIQMMDFNIYSPIKLETCVKKLIQLFYNILQNPDQEKYRKVTLLSAVIILQQCQGATRQMSLVLLRLRPTMQPSERTFWTAQSKVKSCC